MYGKLTEVLNGTFTSASVLEVPITQLAVDSGYAGTEGYQWARKQGHRVVVLKGGSAPIVMGPARAEIVLGRPEQELAR